MNNSEIAAWWGAIAASGLLVWDVVKWLRSKAVLRMTANPNAWYSDSEVVSETKFEDAISRKLKPYIHIELTNIGTMPTTIMCIEAVRPWKGGQVGQSGPGFQEHFGKKLPHVLYPGEVWSCRADQKQLYNLPGDGPLEIKVVASHKIRPLVKKLKIPTESDRRRT